MKNFKSWISKTNFLIAFLSLVGLVDAIYLTIHHYVARPVPCSIVEGCEKVLTSKYATVYNIPIAIFGAIAYFLVIVLVIFSTFTGKFRSLLLIQTAIMAGFSAWLVYLQAFVIESFCQFCLLSAGISFALFALVSIKKLYGSK